MRLGTKKALPMICFRLASNQKLILNTSNFKKADQTLLVLLFQKAP